MVLRCALPGEALRAPFAAAVCIAVGHAALAGCAAALTCLDMSRRHLVFDCVLLLLALRASAARRPDTLSG